MNLAHKYWRAHLELGGYAQSPILVELGAVPPKHYVRQIRTEE